MANTRIYEAYARTKQPRNKYGLIDTSILAGGGSFYNSSSNTTAVGGSMVDLKDFRGATRTENGVRGIVPAPMAGQDQYFLQGNGNWTDIPAFRWLTEFPKSDGLQKTGLELNGNLNVTDTITTMNLEVQGAAHFWSLVIDEVKAQGGQVLVSPSLFKVDYVGDIKEYPLFDVSKNNPLINLITSRTDIYNICMANNIQEIRCRRLYMKCDDGTRRIKNECQIGDMMRCRSFNIQAGKYRNVSNTDYWSFICNVNGDENTETFTDEEGNTYDALFIDLAFALRDSSGHNYPIGTILFKDGSTPIFPSGYEEITDTLELKQTSQEAWDGTRYVTQEFFENEEWTSIQEQVIKVRGLDDQLEAITGLASSDKLYTNEKYLDKTETLLDNALNGPVNTESAGDTTSTRRAAPRSLEDTAQMIVNGEPTISVEQSVNELEEKEMENLSEAISGNTDKPAKYRLKILEDGESIITLTKDTLLEREFIVKGDVIDEEGQVLYTDGEVINPVTEIDGLKANVNVIEAGKKFNLFKSENVDGAEETDITDTDEGEEIQTTTPDTTTGVNRDTNEAINKVYYDATEWQFGYVQKYKNFRIKQGDSLACLGHLYNPDRQNAIVLSSTNPIDPELEAPAMAQYRHIDLFGKSISQFRQTAIAANGNEFIGQFMVNYNDTYLDINDKINLMVMDIKTGLEKVGIHLDGDNSTITLVGSVDLRQHSDKSYDTLNLYDNAGIKRVEIKPFDIPKKNSAESQVDSNKYKFNYLYNCVVAPEDYIYHERWKDWNDGKLFSYQWANRYTLQNFIITGTTSLSLGKLYAGYKLRLTDLQLLFSSQAYLVGSEHVTYRGNNNQKINSLTFTLKKNGVSVPGMSNIDITFSHSDVDLEDISLYGAEVLKSYTIPEDGTYSLYVTASMTVYARYRNGWNYTNKYYTVYYNLSGDINAEISKAEGNNDNKYKFTIGTNGFNLDVDVAKHFYVANDGFELKWDNNWITFDNTRGLYIRRQPTSDIVSDTQLGVDREIVFCKNVNASYTVTLPDPQEYGLFREITILGWSAGNTSVVISPKYLTIAAKSGSNIEFISTYYSDPVTSFNFGQWDSQLMINKPPFQAITLMATGTTTWRVINYI